MASIRNRSPWRVSVPGHPELEARFASKGRAQRHAESLVNQGHSKARVSQDRDGAWEARVRRRGSPELVETFPTKRAAEDWAAAREGEIVKREFVDYREADRHTLGGILKRFEEEVVAPKGKNSPEHYRIRALQRDPIAHIRMSALQPEDVHKLKERLEQRGLKPASVIKDLSLLSRVIKKARSTWNIRMPINPATGEFVERPRPGSAGERDRTLRKQHEQPCAEDVLRRLARGKERLAAAERKILKLRARGLQLRFHPSVAWLLERPMSEEQALLRAARYPHWYRGVPAPLNPSQELLNTACLPLKRGRRGRVRIWAVISFAIETAMRRGELAKLEWEHVKLEEGYLALPASICKGNRARDVPLSPRALRILRTQPKVGARVFNTTEEALETAYECVFARCGAKDLHFHDFRHEATTRLVQNTTLPPLLIGRITGHRDQRMLNRYYNPKPEEAVALFRASRR